MAEETKLTRGEVDSLENQVDYCAVHLGGATVKRVAAQLDWTESRVEAAVRQSGRIEQFKDADRKEPYLRLKD